MAADSESPLSFPCDFIFKIIGKDDPTFEAEVIGIMRHHFPNLGEGAVKFTPSKKGKYLSLSVTVQAISQAQLDATYTDLCACSKVIFVL